MGESISNSSRRGGSSESNQPKRLKDVLGGCGSFPVGTLARCLRAPWEEARAESPSHVKHDNGEINGKVHRGETEGHHGICGIPEGFARRHDVM